MCALKRIAVEVHNVAVHDRDLMRISSLSGLDYTTHIYKHTVPALTHADLHRIGTLCTIKTCLFER